MDQPARSTGFTPSHPFDLDRALHRFGLEAFRPGQREAIETLLGAGRLLLVAPTGGGKSLTYQLPAGLLEGTTLVVSPLVSLMQDQVASLRERDVAATFLSSTLEPGEMGRRLRDIAREAYKLVYVTPERLAFAGFRELVDRLRCPLVAVDEAHCISEWGHDFRPDYLQIGGMLRRLPAARVLACTATATPVVRDEILARLGLDPGTPQLVRGFARPNLALRAAEVRSGAERARRVDALLREAVGGPQAPRGGAIVYAPTRRSTETEAERLRGSGWRVAPYHAGLDAADRDRAQMAFMAGDLDVIVATNAFGMGIDRADVRAVVHLAPPGSIEAYYQEVGRAGRDGEDALGLLLVAPNDLPVRRRLIERGADGEEPDPEVVRHKWNLFLELLRWAEGGSCRHDAILRYFGDEEETLAGCGRCDVCRGLDAGAADDPAEVSVVVRKALSAVARLKGRFGLTAAAHLLMGKEDLRLRREGLEETKTFGALADRPEEWLVRLLRRCVTAGWVDFEGGERPVVVLTDEGRGVLFSERPVRLLLPAEAGRAERPGAGRRGRGAAGGSDDALDPAQSALFEALRRHRLRVARDQGVPPYVVASDRTLREIARQRPRTPEELALVPGIGPAKLERYGAGLLEIVREAAGDGGRS